MIRQIAMSLLFWAEPALAWCPCSEVETPAEAFEGDSQVFVATVLKIDRSQKTVSVSLRVTEPFKGLSGAGSISIESAKDGCMYPFEVGRQYLVYGQVKDGKMTTSVCRRTGPFAWSSKEIDLLRKRVNAPPRSERWFE